MEYLISNNSLSVSVHKIGAEISSIKSQKSGKQYMWDGNPEIWGNYAPVLFPAIGSFKNNKCTIYGKEYNLPKHGFIRGNNSLVVKDHSKTEISFQLDYSEETLKIYPFKFRFIIKFQLQENTLIVSHQVVNLDENEIYFSLGAHPAFKCPLNENENYTDYYLEFDSEETAISHHVTNEGLISENTTTIFSDTNILPLTRTMFDNDALVFKSLKSRGVSLKSKVSDQIITVKYSDFSHLGIWAKPKANFVCIEPWIGVADSENTDGDFLKKEGLITLPVEEKYEAEYSIHINE